ncbi:cytochrome C [Burkholderia singularis]|uniref:Cytochrome C n=1 Tax=Burkholderia singularis TaxID=1503053 RepID=A0A103DYX2_9BURK|nr:MULTISPECIES: c-type cytochrome [Burkholderia]AOK30531.1 cytochrome C [Burkholderia sp. Bp7605]KVE24961.1 cytochrome C [Burkholderia singularis]
MESRVSSRRLFRPLFAVLLTGAAGLLSTAHAQTKPTEPAAAKAPLKAPDTMAERVRGCTACHGTQGQGTDNDYFPRLAGKPAEYLYNQLVNFRDGRRKYPPMNYLLTYLNDDYLREIAQHFSEQRPPYPAPAKPTVPAAVVERGKQLALRGDPSKKLPACVACHGTALTGMQPAIPGLVGLHSDYLSAQIGAWRSGTRHAKAPDCMHEVASKLSDEDVTAVTAWLAAQPAPANPVPAPARSMKTPLACGSEPQ